MTMTPYRWRVVSAWIRRATPDSKEYHPALGGLIYERWMALIDFVFSEEGKKQWPQLPSRLCPHLR